MQVSIAVSLVEVLTVTVPFCDNLKIGSLFLNFSECVSFLILQTGGRVADKTKK